MMELIAQGGKLMYVILSCSVIAVGVIIERLVSLRRASTDSSALIEELSVVIENNQIDKALKICEEKPGPIANICSAALLKYDRGKDEIKEAIESSANLEVPHLEKHLGILSTIAHITPLLGLLGTVLGMITAFNKIADVSKAGGAVGADIVADGIGQALITTAFGLIVAIPTYVFYNFLLSRVDSQVVDMEESAIHLTNIIGSKKGF
jgi:biopolymer transport protein ExbB